jgi:3-oxoacyl-[acyl-carrier protein] reductase
LFIHFFRQNIDFPDKNQRNRSSQEPGLEFFLEQQRKTADEVVASIRKTGGKAQSWEGDLRNPENVHRLFEEAEKAFGQVDILVNNAAEYIADTFLPSITLGKEAELWEGGPTISTIDVESHDRHFAVNSRAVLS